MNLFQEVLPESKQLKIIFMKRLVLLFIIGIISHPAWSQVTISGEIRPRTEFRDGYKSLNSEATDAAFFTSQRSRLNLEYKSDKYTAFLSVQDVRVWGDEKFGSDVAALALQEAWIKFRLADSLSLKGGRQVINYGDGRLFGAANWSQTSKKHDALILNYKSGPWNIDLGNAFNQLAENTFDTDYTNGQGNYKYLSYLWATHTTQALSLTGLFIADGYQYAVDTVYSRLTWGALASYTKKRLTLNAKYHGQGGKTPTGQKIAASLLNADLCYKMGKFEPTLGFERQSGTDYTKTDGKYGAFNTLYGAKHYLNGTMDYFTGTSDTKNTGLLDIYLKTKCKIGKKSTLMADYHYFATAEDYYNKATKAVMDRYLASEVDLYVRTPISKDIKLEYGCSGLVGSQTLAAMKSGENGKLNSWMYVMVCFSPVFFKSK